MCTLSSILGLLIVVFGVGLCGMSHVGGGRLICVFGIVLTAAGVIICNRALHTSCPQCSEQVKLTALKCMHCGSLLSLV
jgi:multisubunit Na+/H+ antiporter MnhG subunit